MLYFSMCNNIITSCMISFCINKNNLCSFNNRIVSFLLPNKWKYLKSQKRNICQYFQYLRSYFPKHFSGGNGLTWIQTQQVNVQSSPPTFGQYWSSADSEKLSSDTGMLGFVKKHLLDLDKSCLIFNLENRLLKMKLGANIRPNWFQ